MPSDTKVFDSTLPNKKIIGVCGPKGHGKDTFAKLLQRVIPETKRRAFADSLKDICSKVYEVPREVFDSVTDKEKKFEAPIVIDRYIDRLRAETGLGGIKYAELVAETPRQLLQYVGTDYVRKASPDYWRNRLLQDVDDYNVITDVRFGNEAEMIKGRGGIVVKIVRLGGPRVKDAHASEKLDFPVDCTLAITEHNWAWPLMFITSLAKYWRQDAPMDYVQYDWYRVLAMVPVDGPWLEKAMCYYGGHLLPVLGGQWD